MPIYEYVCEECGASFELLVRSAAQQEQITCPRCGGTRARKRISLFGFGSKGAQDAGAAPSCGPAPT